MRFSNPPIAFIFAVVPKRPRSVEEQKNLSAVKQQWGIIKRYMQTEDISEANWMLDLTTYRSAAFIDRPTFKSAQRKALAENRQILVASTADLLRTLNPMKVIDILPRLIATEAEVLDCRASKAWKDFGLSEMQPMVFNAKILAQHSAVIKGGFESGGERTWDAVRPNGKLGAKQNATRANRDAERLFPLINELYLTVEPGATLSPSRLMHHLNDLGIPPSRAGKWSFNACKNLIERYLTSRSAGNRD